MANLSSVLLHATIILLSLGCVRSSPLNQQSPLSVPGVPCEDAGKFSTEWFLLHTRPGFRAEINQRALFYTRNTSAQARELACSSDKYVTIWDIWPSWLYDSTLSPSNGMRCIHNDGVRVRTAFYENMSRAYARMARGSATVMHLNADFERPPLDGIWGRVELPTIQNMTDIFEIRKISDDLGRVRKWLVPRKAAREVWERAMREVRELFRRAREGVSGENRPREGEGVSERGEEACAWYPEAERFLDGLW